MPKLSSKIRSTYDIVTERVIEAILRNKEAPWRKPWRTDGISQLPSNFAKGWVAALREKPRMLIEAASAAQRAVDHILGKADPRETNHLEQDTFTKGQIEKEEI